MKKRTILLLVAAATVTSLWAQPRANRTTLSPEQQTQMQEIRNKYAPEIKDIRDEIRLKHVEQNTLLASKIIDGKAVYATIDAIGKLRASLHETTSAQREALQQVCPNADKAWAYQRGQRSMQEQGFHQGQGNQQGMRSGQGRQGMGQCATPQRQQMKNNKGQRPQGKHMAIGQGARKGMKHHQALGQGYQGQGIMFGPNCQLTDKQKTMMANIRKEHFWNIQETQNKLALLKAQNTTPEERQAAFSEINTLQTKLAKQRMTMHLEMMSELTEDQRIQMLSQRKHHNTFAQYHKKTRKA